MRPAWLILLLGISATAWGKSPVWPELSTQAFTQASQAYSLTLPRGMQLRFLAAMDQPRMMFRADGGILLVGSRSGWIYRLAPPYRRAEPLLRLGDYPHSVVYRDGYLYIARTSGVYRVPYALKENRLDKDRLQKLAALPGGGGHNSRSLELGPDGKLYVSLGIRGNCSNQYLGKGYDFDDRRGGLMRLDESVSPPRWQVYASGLRNPVGYDWDPRSGDIYLSNNGPDHLGYDQPPEYFSRARFGSFHGMPWFQYNGQRLVRDDCIGTKPPRPAQDVTLPVATFPARNAPMGVKFIRHSRWPFLQGRALVALHGSWAKKPDGGYWGDASTRRSPAIVSVALDDDGAAAVVPLLGGLQNGAGERLARPLDIETSPGGDILFTSDGGQLEGLFCLCQTSAESLH